MSATAKEVAEEQTTKPIKPLVRKDVVFEDSRIMHWVAMVPGHTTREQLVQSALWSVVSHEFHSFDRITAIALDRSFLCELVVLDAGRGYASVQLLHYHQLPALLTTTAGLPPGFEVRWLGEETDQMYGAVRTCDGVIIVRGQTSRELCIAELLRHASLRG